MNNVLTQNSFYVYHEDSDRVGTVTEEGRKVVCAQCG